MMEPTQLAEFLQVAERSMAELSRRAADESEPPPVRRAAFWRWARQAAEVVLVVDTVNPAEGTPARESLECLRQAVAGALSSYAVASLGETSGQH